MDLNQGSSAQQLGSSESQTGNPQQIGVPTLQPQQGSQLQTTSNQTVNQLNTLNSGSQTIPLAITGTPASSTQATPNTTTPPAHHNYFLWGGLVVLVVGFVVFVGYGLMRQT